MIKIRESDVHADEVRVCDALWHALDNAHPRLPIDEGLATVLECTRATLLAEDRLVMWYGTWPDVLDGVRWGEDANAGGPYAGKELLRFFGCLGFVEIQVSHGFPFVIQAADGPIRFD